MGGTVVVDLVVLPDAFGEELVEGGDDVRPDTGVGVLVDYDGRGRVPDEHRADPLADARLRHHRRHLACKVDDLELLPAPEADAPLHAGPIVARWRDLRPNRTSTIDAARPT